MHATQAFGLSEKAPYEPRPRHRRPILRRIRDPFHVVDEEVVILSVDHPFVPEGRVASLMVRDAALAKRLAEGFETLWAKAVRSLREIAFQPGQ